MNVETLQSRIDDENSEEICFDEMYNEINLASGPALDTLPVEVLMRICTFLDALYVSQTLSRVCRRFSEILSDQRLWKYWVGKRLCHTYPLVPRMMEDIRFDFKWEDAYVDIDREETKWTNNLKKMRHVIVRDVHYAAIDSIILFNNGQLCASGGRDRGLALWSIENISSTDGSSNPLHMKTDAHKGWVWDLAVCNATASPIIYSASWDNTIKAWDIETGLNCIETYQCRMSVLSVVCEDNLILAGLCAHKVVLFDRRIGDTCPISSYRAHRGSVLALSTHSGLVSSAGEDHTVAIWDQRASKILVAGLKMPGADKAYPSTLNWGPLGLLVGDSRGAIHALKVRDGKTSLEGSSQLWEGRHKVSGVAQRAGCIVACCEMGMVKFLHPSLPPKQFAYVTSGTASITGLQYENDVLAISTCDSAIEFWIEDDTGETILGQN